uniref:Transmembrane protein 170A n=1 Tax=Leptobrachium leishanense TaxID=445787 RepID=A0A8C5PAD3_9ANUR
LPATRFSDVAHRLRVRYARAKPHCAPFRRCGMVYSYGHWCLLFFSHIPAGLLSLFTLRHHKYGRFMTVGILLMGIIGPITAGILTSAAIAGVYRAAAKDMIPFEALVLGVGQTFCVLMVSFLRILATL